jgi:hypothetical protein
VNIPHAEVLSSVDHPLMIVVDNGGHARVLGRLSDQAVAETLRQLLHHFEGKAGAVPGSTVPGDGPTADEVFREIEHGISDGWPLATVQVALRVTGAAVRAALGKVVEAREQARRVAAHWRFRAIAENAKVRAARDWANEHGRQELVELLPVDYFPCGCAEVCPLTEADARAASRLAGKSGVDL